MTAIALRLPLTTVTSVWSWLAWGLIALILPFYVLTARGVAALRSATGREGQDIINTPELGPIPVGIIRRLTAGWMGGAVVVILSVFSPELAAAVLAVNLAAAFHSYHQLAQARTTN